MKITSDGYIWKIISPEQAIVIFENNLFELCVLYDDDTETTIEAEHQLKSYIEEGYDIGISVGNIKTDK